MSQMDSAQDNARDRLLRLRDAGNTHLRSCVAASCSNTCSASTPNKRPDTSLRGTLSPLLEVMEYAAALMDVMDDSDPHEIAIFRCLAADLTACQSINGTPEVYFCARSLLANTQSLVNHLNPGDPGQVGEDFAATLCRVKIELEAVQAAVEGIASRVVPEN